MRGYAGVVARLLGRGVPVLVITGLNDGKDTNFIGARRWIATLRWRGSGLYTRVVRTRWRLGDSVLGYRRTGGG